MYHDFYEFKENPFNVTPDPHFFFSSKCHMEAFSNLLYGIQQRKGILVTVGEVGTGKTTLCRKLLSQKDNYLKIACILNPNFSELELLQLIVHELRIHTFEKDKFGLINAIHKFLLKQARRGKNVVLLIDEAQNLTINQLEQIRLLSNIETEKEKLLQIILVGQPELDVKLNLPALRQLKQRVVIYINLEPLSKADIKSYIQHRIKMVIRSPSATRNIIFSEKAIDAVHHYTEGTPRKINILCDRALLAGFIAETYLIDEIIIENSAREIQY
jgi:general secretion pathway protein A